jgi:hypothetical protein
MPRILRSPALLVGISLLAVAPAAHTSTVRVDGAALIVTAAPGEANNVLLSTYGYVGDTAGLTLGPGCGPWDDDPTKADCGVAFTSVVVDLGDGDDR